MSERDRILIAFVELVAERGFSDVDATFVERRAAVDGDAFARHFADPSECFIAAWDRLEGEYMRRLSAACGDLGGWRDRFRVAAAETVRLVEAYPRQARFMTVEALSVERASTRQQALASRLGALVDTAREEVENPTAVPNATAGWIVAIFFDRIYRRFTTDQEPDLAAQLPELMFLAVSSYFGTAEGLAELDIVP